MHESNSDTEGRVPFKEWRSAAEWAALRLLGFPSSVRGVLDYMERTIGREDGPQRRPREGRGGGFEFHYTVLPLELMRAYELMFGNEVDVLADVWTWHGLGVLAFGEGGMLRQYIIKVCHMEPGVSAGRVRDLCIGRFGADVRVVDGGRWRMVKMPSLRLFTMLVTELRVERRDGFRSSAGAVSHAKH